MDVYIPVDLSDFYLSNENRKFKLPNRLEMKVLLDIKDNKGKFFMELLRNFSYVKIKPLSSENLLFLEELKGSIEEVNLAKKGKLKLQSARDFLNDL